MNTLRLIANAGAAVGLLGLALGTKDKVWRSAGIVLAALNLAVVLAYLLGWT
jgi:hypothetical protein